MKQTENTKKNPLIALDNLLDQDHSNDLGEKFFWYNSLLQTIILCTENEDSQDYKEFFENKELTDDLGSIIRNAIRPDAPDLMALIDDDYSKGMSHFLKTNKDALIKVITIRVDQLIKDYISQANSVISEDSLDSNSLVYHANVLEQLTSLPHKFDEPLQQAVVKAIDVAAEHVEKSYNAYKEEITNAHLGPVRCAWISLLFVENHEMISFVVGEWKLKKLLDYVIELEKSLPDLNEKKMSTKEQSMYFDLMLKAIKDGDFCREDVDLKEDCSCCCQDEADQCDCCE